MSTLRPALKRKLIDSFSLLFFHSFLSKLARVMIHRYQAKRNTHEKLAFPFIKKRKSNNLQILTYHRVNDDHDPFFTGLPTNIFAAQMEYIASHFHVIPLEEAIEHIQRRDIPDNAIVVTFDDGYKDVYVNAFPVLKQYSIPATIFLATSVIGSGKVLWHDRVFSAFRETRQPLLSAYGKYGKTYSLQTLEEKIAAQHETLKFLWSLDECEKHSWVDILIKKLRVVEKDDCKDLMMNWDDVRIMHQHGIFFGSHTVTHPILSRVSYSQALEEIQISKKIIEAHIQAPIKTFAYPNGKKGDMNKEIKCILQESGYICALTTMFGTNEDKQDVFELRRGGPWATYLPTFALQLSWGKFCS